MRIEYDNHGAAKLQELERRKLPTNGPEWAHLHCYYGGEMRCVLEVTDRDGRYAVGYLDRDNGVLTAHFPGTEAFSTSCVDQAFDFTRARLEEWLSSYRRRRA